MAEATRNELGPELSPAQRLKRSAIAVLFFLILLIPRVRRLRRRVKLWTGIRVASGLSGAALLWTYYHGNGTGCLAAGAALMLFALLMRATPVKKSVEDRARELGALVVLNAGKWVPSSGEPARAVNILAGSERLTVEDGSGLALFEIPLAKIHLAAARALEPGEGKPWELELTWSAPAPQSAKFHFHGFFAEHLARVAEATIQNLRKPDLPILR